MQTAEFDPMDFQSEKQRDLDKSLLVKFFIKPVQDHEATSREGRPIFKDVEYVDIRIPGKKSGGVARPARVTDLERFPEHYRRFKNRQEMPQDGTPLAEWPPISRSMVEQLAYLNIKTVEQLAELNDNHCSQIMGGHTFKQKAKDFLEYADKVKDETQVADLKRENAELREQMAELQEQMQSIMSAKTASVDAEDEKIEPASQRKAQKKKTVQKRNPLT